MSDEPPKKKPRLTELESTKIFEIPEEMLTAIFNYLSFDDLMQLMSVCKLFYDVLQLPIFAKKIVLALECCVLSPLCPPYNFLVNSERKFYNLRFGDKVCVWHCRRRLWQQIGQHVEHIIFSSASTYEGFDFILDEFPNVIEVSIFLEDLLKLEISQSVKNINILGYCDQFVSKEEFQKLNDIFQGLNQIIVSNICVSKEVQFGREKLFDVKVTKGIDWSGFQSDPMIEVVPFDLKQNKCITAADIADITENIQSWILESLDDFINLQQLTLNMAENGCFFLHSQQMLPKLFHIHIICFVNNTVGYCKTCLKCMKESSSKIDSLRLAGKQFPRINKFIESLPSKSLKSLTLTMIMNYNEISFDYPELEKLELHYFKPQKFFNCSDLPYSPKLKMLKFKSVVIGCMQDDITPSEIQVLAQKCPNVKKAEFYSLTLNEILVIEEGWPNLIELKCGNYSFDEMELLEWLQGNFKRLKVFDDIMQNSTKKEEEKDFGYSQIDGELFKKIPTLRQSYTMNYQTYCMLEHGIPEMHSKLLTYDY